MANSRTPEAPSGPTLDASSDGASYTLHVKGAAPIRLGIEEAARLGRYLTGEHTPPHIDPPAPWQHEEEPEPIRAERTAVDAETGEPVEVGVVLDAAGVEHVGVIPAE